MINQTKWTASDESTHALISDGTKYIAEVFHYDMGTLIRDSDKSIALITAAPELLEALQWLLNNPNDERGSHTAITYAQSIIAKATGA